MAVFIEQDETAGALASAREELHGGLGGAGGSGIGGAEKIGGGFGHHHPHDGFAIASGRDTSRFRIGVTTTTNQRGISDAARELATGAASGGGSEKAAVLVERNSADGSLFVAAMIFSGVGVLAAAKPGFALGGRDEVFGVAEPDAMRVGEIFGALGDEHHVGTFFEDRAGGLDGIFNATQSCDGASAERCGVHDDGVALDVAIKSEMRAEAGIEDGIVFEDDDGGFDGVERVATGFQNIPASLKSAKAAGFTNVDGIIGDVPGAAMNNEGRLHRGEE